MTISINVICRRDKANKNGTVPVHLRFTQGPRIRYVSTGIAIVPTAWDAQNQRLIIQDEESQEMQYRIDSLLAEYHKRLKRLEVLEADITLDNLLETNGRKNNCTIAEYFAQAVTRLQAQGKINTATKYRFTQVSLQKALPPSLRFDELTLATPARSGTKATRSGLYLEQHSHQNQRIESRLQQGIGRQSVYLQGKPVHNL